MKITTAFPSDYLRAADLGGRNVTVTMERVEMKDFGGDFKPVLYFEGKQRGLVLNKTNSGTISDAYGDETEEWAGQQIVLFEATVEFQGRRVPAIRVKAPPRKQSAPPERPAPAPIKPDGNGHVIEDEIPF